LEKIYGRTYENGYCVIKIYQEICKKFKYPGIVTVFKVRRLERLTRVVRMDGESTVRKLLEGKSGGTKRKEDLD
jgi:Fe-S cluster assembly ATPase SufC